jgi:hypothetical protein
MSTASKQTPSSSKKKNLTHHEAHASVNHVAVGSAAAEGGMLVGVCEFFAPDGANDMQVIFSLQPSYPIPIP